MTSLILLVDLENYLPDLRSSPPGRAEADYRFKWLADYPGETDKYLESLLQLCINFTVPDVIARSFTCDHDSTLGRACSHGSDVTCGCTLQATRCNPTKSVMVHAQERSLGPTPSMSRASLAFASTAQVPQATTTVQLRLIRREQLGFHPDPAQARGFGRLNRLENTVGDDHADQLAAWMYELIMAVKGDDFPELMVLTSDGNPRTVGAGASSRAKENCWVRVLDHHLRSSNAWAREQQGRDEPRTTVMPFFLWNWGKEPKVSKRYLNASTWIPYVDPPSDAQKRQAIEKCVSPGFPIGQTDPPVHCQSFVAAVWAHALSNQANPVRIEPAVWESLRKHAFDLFGQVGKPLQRKAKGQDLKKATREAILGFRCSDPDCPCGDNKDLSDASLDSGTSVDQMRCVLLGHVVASAPPFTESEETIEEQVRDLFQSFDLGSIVSRDEIEAVATYVGGRSTKTSGADGPQSLMTGARGGRDTASGPRVR